MPVTTRAGEVAGITEAVLNVFPLQALVSPPLPTCQALAVTYWSCVSAEEPGTDGLE